MGRLIPSFNGKHNALRAKCWLVLYFHQRDGGKGLLLSELARLSGGDYHSTASSLGKWAKWNYISSIGPLGKRRYRLLRRGKAWLERWQDIMPLDQYLREIGMQK